MVMDSVERTGGLDAGDRIECDDEYDIYLIGYEVG